MRFFLPVVLFFSGLSVSAQQYLIRYDMHNMKSDYFRIDRDTSKVRKIDLKRNGRVVVRVDNFNPFYWDAKVTAYKSEAPEESDYGSAFNPLSFFSKGFGDIIGNLPLLDLPASKGTGTDANSRFLNAAAQYAEQYQKVVALSEKIDEFQMIKLQLKELKFDFTKTEKQIKTEATALVKKAFALEDPSLINIVSAGKDYSRSLNSSLDQLDKLGGQVQQQLSNVNPESRIEGQTFREIAQKSGSSQLALGRIKEAQQRNPNLIMDEAVEIGNLYRDISNANFHFNYAINTDAELSALKLQLFPKPGIASNDTLVQFFQVKEKRNLKIRNSVGAAFTYFTSNNTKYFVDEDSIIRKSGKDLFSPLIATFIHFYSGRTSGLKWGGTFGIGIPITGEKKDINFLLGLTTAFGQNEPILLSFGISGAKVNKLTNGYTLGAKTREMNEDRLVTSGYDVGGFISVSFNLGSFGKK